MSIGNSFFGNYQQNSNSETAFEILLRKASLDPALRTEFYNKLLSEPLIILVATPTSSQDIQDLEQGASLKIMNFEDGRVPIFTSEPRIFDKGVIQKDVPILKKMGKDIFQFLIGATFLLNPFSVYGKELFPNEIKGLLADSLSGNNYNKIEIPANTTVALGQPAVYPIEVVKALNKLFVDLPSVRAAYLGWIFYSSSGNPPNLIVGLEIEGNVQSVMNKASSVARLFAKPDEVIDFIQLGSKDKVSDYLLKETKPFYVTTKKVLN